MRRHRARWWTAALTGALLVGVASPTTAQGPGMQRRQERRDLRQQQLGVAPSTSAPATPGGPGYPSEPAPGTPAYPGGPVYPGVPATAGTPGSAAGPAAAAGSAVAPPVQEPIVYPGQGKTPDQLARDQASCRAWAKQQAQSDPAVAAAAPAAPAAGAGGAASATGQGPAGPAAGGAFGGMPTRRQVSQQQGVFYQAQQAYQRALEACLVGLGYTPQ